MSTTRAVAVLVSAVILVGSGCTGPRPIYNVSNGVISSSKSNPTMDEVGKAIVRAGAALGWNMQQTNPGQILGTLHLRTHMAAVDVTYDTKSFNIRYKDSSNLGYDGTNIHSNYNGWVQNLEKGIRTQLSLL